MQSYNQESANNLVPISNHKMPINQDIQSTILCYDYEMLTLE